MLIGIFTKNTFIWLFYSVSTILCVDTRNIVKNNDKTIIVVNSECDLYIILN